MALSPSSHPHADGTFLCFHFHNLVLSEGKTCCLCESTGIKCKEEKFFFLLAHTLYVQQAMSEVCMKKLQNIKSWRAYRCGWTVERLAP